MPQSERKQSIVTPSGIFRPRIVQEPEIDDRWQERHDVSRTSAGAHPGTHHEHSNFQCAGTWTEYKQIAEFYIDSFDHPVTGVSARKGQSSTDKTLQEEYASPQYRSKASCSHP